MSTRALGGADPLAPVRYLDVVLVVLAAPFVLLLGAPVLGYAVGAAAWIVGRLLEAWLDQAARRSDPRRAIGLKVASMIGRTWLIGVAILAVGLAAEREDGFAAGLLCLAAYTVHLATSLILRPLERTPKQP
jgi:peptidoglycan biosynthesis protein MviN/MurJ (putative lipid II flippase)